MVPWGGGVYVTVVVLCGPSSTDACCESGMYSTVLTETAVIQPSALNSGRTQFICECSPAYRNTSSGGSSCPSCDQSFKNTLLTTPRRLLEHLLKVPCL